jgi:hypothetical protein
MPVGVRVTYFFFAAFFVLRAVFFAGFLAAFFAILANVSLLSMSSRESAHGLL